MKTSKIESAIFKTVEAGEGIFTFQAPVTRSPRQTFLTEKAIDSVDVIEDCGVRWQLWWIIDDKKSPVTCIECPYRTYGEDQITYIDKKRKLELIVRVHSVGVEKLNGKWMWNVTVEKI